MYIHRSRQEAVLISPRLTVAILPSLTRPHLSLYFRVTPNSRNSSVVYWFSGRKIILAISDYISVSVNRSEFPCFSETPHIFDTFPPCNVENSKFYRELHLTSIAAASEYKIFERCFTKTLTEDAGRCREHISGMSVRVESQETCVSSLSLSLVFNEMI